MRKVLLGALIIVIIGAIFLVLRPITYSEEDFMSSWNEKWEIKLPTPERIETLIRTEMPARGDGEWLYAFYYSEPLQKMSELGFEEVTPINQTEVERLISNFKQDTVNTHIGNQEKQKNITQAFQQLNKTVSENDYYRYYAKNGGQDYYIAHYQSEQNRILLYEWHQ